MTALTSLPIDHARRLLPSFEPMTPLEAEVLWQMWLTDAEPNPASCVPLRLPSRDEVRRARAALEPTS